jgi:hypothetical protein
MSVRTLNIHLRQVHVPLHQFRWTVHQALIKNERIPHVLQEYRRFHM